MLVSFPDLLGVLKGGSLGRDYLYRCMKPALGSFPDNLAMIGSFSAAAQLYVVSSTTHTGSNGELSAWNKDIAEVL